MTFDHLIDLDGNGRPVYGDSPFSVVKRHTFVGNNATVAVPLFTVVGAVMCTRLWGVVTTVLGNNHTATHWRINDQTASDQVITKATGTTLSSAGAGSLIMKVGLASAALTLKSSAAGALLEPTTLETMVFSPFVVVQKVGGVQTDIEYVYTTTNTPTTGAIEFHVSYYPLSASSYIASA